MFWYKIMIRVSKRVVFFVGKICCDYFPSAFVQRLNSSELQCLESHEQASNILQVVNCHPKDNIEILRIRYATLRRQLSKTSCANADISLQSAKLAFKKTKQYISKISEIYQRQNYNLRMKLDRSDKNFFLKEIITEL